MLSVDTANFEEAKKYVQQLGTCKMITSNPKIFSNEQGINFKQRIKELLSLNVPVSVELVSQNCSVKDLVKEALSYKEEFKSENLVVKVPMWRNGKGLEVAKKLVENNLEVNLTCLMNMNQVVLACEVGATYASLFYRRMIDYETTPNEAVQKQNVAKIIRNCRVFIDQERYVTKIICGSIREPKDVSECLVAGAHIVTITPKILEQLPFHQKTEEVVTEFNEAWNLFCKGAK
jgi:transaldolase